MTSFDPSTSSRDLIVFGPPPTNLFTFTTGDTKILVTYKGFKIEGSVSSHSLCQASPVWKNFIYPPWGPTGTAALPKTLDCSQDDGDALLILMNIVHLKFSQVPGQPFFETLAAVAQMCELYQCVEIVSPWIKSWKEWTLDGKEYYECASIAWTFGFEDLFGEVVYNITKFSYPTDEGELHWGSGKLIGHLGPPGLLDCILQARSDTIEDMLAIAYNKLTLYETRSSPLCQGLAYQVAVVPGTPITADLSIEAERCDILSHGGLLKSLTGMKLWPRKDAAEIQGCLQDQELLMEDLCDNIPKLDDTIEMFGGFSALLHCDCCSFEYIDFSPVKEQIMKKVVLPEYIEHMRSQRVKLGSETGT